MSSLCTPIKSYSKTMSRPVYIISLLLFTGVFSLFSTAAHADELETLLMPGELIQGHAKYESQCNKCHKRFKRGDGTPLCRACHKKINKDITQKKGFHGRTKKIKSQSCKSCHTDHKGRKADIIKFDKATFAHQYTDFPLKGQHKTVRCTSCHKKGKAYRKAPSSCISCHKKASVHRANKQNSKIFKNCASCHVQTNWRKIRYNHNKTRFKLRGKHAKTACSTCHTNDRYVKTPRNCINCHRLNDIHRGSNGKKCQKCHSTSSWKKLGFDHTKDTDFPLRYSHKKLTCAQCHKGDPYRKKIKSTCVYCHKQDDSHHGNFGKKCQTCHREKNWQSAQFNHNRKTKYPLRGKHKNAQCKACHVKPLYKSKTPTACYSCHKVDDVHKGQEGKRCQNCHDENGWRKKVRFDHDLSRFPLIGLHAVTPCEECHLSNKYKSAKISCLSCHKKDDTHKQKLGENCQACHNPNGWRLWRFNHNKTNFKLTGKHKKVYCEGCHTKAVTKVASTPRTCIGCHRGDDAHNSQFGKRCERCHTTESFNDLKSIR